MRADDFCLLENALFRAFIHEGMSALDAENLTSIVLLEMDDFYDKAFRTGYDEGWHIGAGGLAYESHPAFGEYIP